MATKKVNEAKFTAWTKSGLRMEANGTISACALELFGLIDSPELREKIINLMKLRHADLITHEQINQQKDNQEA